MSAGTELQRVERVIDTAGICAELELLLPAGVRSRQLRVRTLMIGMVMTLLDGRDALLTSVHRTLLKLPTDDQQRLAVIVQWRTGEHTLSYRQLEYTYRLVCATLSKDHRDGNPSEVLSHVLDALLEASVQVLGQPTSSSYAVDWTDLEAWSRPPARAQRGNDNATDGAGPPASQQQHPGQQQQQPEQQQQRRCDREASWGHRNTNHPAKNELFFGYYLQTMTTVKDERGEEVPELARRMQICSCDHDPPGKLVPVIGRMTQDAIPIGDLLADSGYAYRIPETWALPLRALGIQLIQDLHPNDRGVTGTHMGAICHNGNLYCPATPNSLLEHSSPLARGSSTQQTAAHDQRSAELAKYKLAPISAYDQDGYRRVACPATQNKLRCPLRPATLTLPHNRPTIHQPPEQPPVCCQQQTITVPPTINPKTAQKHDYPSPQHRASYQRRTAAERTFATLTDRSSNDLSRGHCRLFGLTAIALLTATALIARNIRIHDAFTNRQAENQRRPAHGLPPRQRKHRRNTLQNLTTTTNTPP